MKKTWITITAFALATCILASCQAGVSGPASSAAESPKESIAAATSVVNNNIRDAIPLSQKLGLPQHFTDQITAGKLSISADADISIPQADKIPVLNAIAADFTQEQVDGFIKAFFNGKTLYEESEELTKSEIQAQLEFLKNSDAPTDDIKKQTETIIAYLTTLLPNAPDQRTITVSDGKLKEIDQKDPMTGDHMYNYSGIRASTDFDDLEHSSGFSVVNNNDIAKTEVVQQNENSTVSRPKKSNAMLVYRSGDHPYNYGQHAPVPVDVYSVIQDEKAKEKLKTTPKQAIELVQNMLKNAGIDYMQLDKAYLVDDENLGRFDGIVSPAEHYAYRMYFVRIADGIPCADLHGISMTGNPGDATAEQWIYETFEVMVDDGGIFLLQWMSPINITGTTTEDAALLPFNQIKEIFDKMIQVKYGQEAKNDYVTNLEIKIDRVSLELQRVSDPGSITDGKLIPVWNFYGVKTEKVKDNTGNEMDQVMGQDYPESFLTVNAMDGTIINMSKGY